jgi:transposase-like protein
MTATHDNIIKSDRRGRLRYTPEQRESLVQACHASGLSTPRFAAIHGVKYQTLATWIHRSNRATTPPRLLSPAPLLLVPVEREGPVSPGVVSPLEIHLPGGAKLTLTTPGHVPFAAALILQLANPQPC